MNDWFKNNLWAILIAIAGVVSSYSLQGYRIDTLESDVNESQAQIQVLNAQQVTQQVQFAQLSVDITYIKQSLDRLLGNR